MVERAVAVGAGAALAALAAAAPGPSASLTLLRHAPDAPDVTGPLVAAVSLLAWALVGWLVLTAVLTAGGRLGGPLGAGCRALLRRTAPAALRRFVAVALGVGIALGSSGTASAAEPLPAATPSAAPAAPVPSVEAVAATLDWPLAPATPAAPPGPPAPVPSGSGATVVVVPGDTLWGLAEAHLPDGASTADIAAAWPSWWSANRQVIGEDPDLLHPGQHLQVPPAGAVPGPH